MYVAVCDSMEKGDIVFLEYDAFVVKREGEEEIIETTNEALAREKNIYDEQFRYVPRPVIVGVGKVLKGLDESLLQAEINKEYVIEIPPEKAYGPRDPKLVELRSMREIMRLPEFRKGDVTPMPGMKLTLKNREGTILTVGAGRVRIDFNNPYAGKTIKYRYVVRSKAETAEEKVRALIEMHYGDEHLFDVKIDDDTSTIKIPERCKLDSRWLSAKLQIVIDIRVRAGIDNIIFIEEYIKPKDVKKEEVKKEDVKKEDMKNEEKDEVDDLKDEKKESDE